MIPLNRKITQSGWLAEIFREDVVGKFKQIYAFTIKPGETRGKHYHKKKREWFCVLEGEAEVNTIDVRYSTSIARKQYVLNDLWLKVLEVEPYIHHTIKNNTFHDIMVISASSELYDQNDTDTFTLEDNKNK
jgi:UDP-2-acetamido-2,6-beta-L-arabino-hexul-4-ose reductase